MRLNLGCGRQIKPGWVNVDTVDLPGVDVIHDLDVFPWPLGDESFEYVEAFDVFEHVNDPLGFMAECWRILKVDGELNIHTTHWQTENSYTDPTHKRFCTEQTFDYWIPGTYLNERYGPMYARGRHFKRITRRRDGQEIEFRLQKIKETS